MQNLWIIFAFIAMFVSGIHTICLKYMNNKFIDIGLAFIFLFAGFLSLVYILFNNNRFINFLHLWTFKMPIIYNKIEINL